MKMTPTGCCLLPVTTFQDEKIFIGTGKCYGSDADFQTLKDGSVLKIVNKGIWHRYHRALLQPLLLQPLLSQPLLSQPMFHITFEIPPCSIGLNL